MRERHIEFSVRACLLAGALLLLPMFDGFASAGTVEVKALAAPGGIEIDAKDAPIGDILAKLGAAQGIKIEQIGDDAPVRTWSGRISGRTEDVLSRVLESENFVVEHGHGTRSGIQRVRVFAATSSDEIEVTQTPIQSPQQTRAVPQAVPQPQPAVVRPQPSAATSPASRPPVATTPPHAPAPQQRTSQTRSSQAGAQRRGGVVQ